MVRGRGHYPMKSSIFGLGSSGDYSFDGNGRVLECSSTKFAGAVRLGEAQSVS
jgi:hypothetical protein